MKRDLHIALNRHLRREIDIRNMSDEYLKTSIKWCLNKIKEPDDLAPCKNILIYLDHLKDERRERVMTKYHLRKGIE